MYSRIQDHYAATPTLTICADVALLVLFTVVCFETFRTRRNLAPGPPGWPLLGNAFQIPRDKQWLQFDNWIRRYGDVVHINVLGQPSIILGSVEAASELLDSRGTIYSDRPIAIMAGELVGWNRGLGYSPGPPNPRFREFRRLLHQSMGPRPAQGPAMLRMQETSAIKLLARILSDPDAFITHARQVTGALVLRLAYGYEVAEEQKEDYLVNIAEKAMQGFARASEPGAFLVDSFPLLKHLPEWAPGANFKTIARGMREDLEQLYDVPFHIVKSRMSQGNAIPSFTSMYLEGKGTPTPSEEELIKAAAASLYSGGADTTPSSLSSFILAMTLNPSVQARAQVELDSVIGPGWHRLPTFDDRPRLPYINAIVLEILRWNPSVPLGLPHQLVEDDTFQKYLIPKGSIVWANIWSMLHNEAVFPEPSQFRPERYVDESGALKKLDRSQDPAFIGFGFGRRVCPGMYFADNSIFIAIAMMLYVFNISKVKGKDGHEVTPEVEYNGFISHPRPFRCHIVPRSTEAGALIRGSDAA